MIKNLFHTFFSGHERTIRAKKNIIGSFLLKGISIAISLLLVPLTIDYLNPTKYGIWLTLSSVIGWFVFFDIGLGNGLRNKFAIAKAEGNDLLAKVFVSTTYAIITIIAVALFVVFFIVNQFLDWGLILNASNDIHEIEQLVFIVFSVFCFQFVIKLINVIFIADQRPVISSLINTLGSLFSLIVIFILTKTTQGSLLYLGASFSLINLIIPLLASVWAFKGKYKKYSPSFKHIDFSKAKELLNLGMRFFITQVAAIIVAATDNIIIAQLIGNEDVAVYNVAYKYFGVMNMVFTIITAPYWSAFTEAYTKNDMAWVKQATLKIIKLWFIVVAGIIVMLLFSNNAYQLWIGNRLAIPFNLSIIMALWVIVSTSTMIFANFLAGVNKIQLSLYHAIFVSIINIPLSIYFAKNLEMGSTGVILATLIGIIPRAIFQPIQYWKIVNGKANGIWNK
ncbi:MAG: oligosaccharide flippase family protein [Vicingaceae bacterium]|nr:oligosaccharide flippase family protein [Vicingaceae bacterium]